MARHKRTPHDPAKAAAQKAAAKEARDLAAKADAKLRETNPERWGETRLTKTEIAAYDRHDVEYGVDPRGRLKHARKADCFHQLHSKGALTDEQLAAIRRLEADMIMRAGYGASAPTLDKVDRSGDAAAITDTMVDAGKRVDDALALVGPPSSRVLKALVEPGVECQNVDWRAVVQIITGESNDRAQAAVVRLASQSLADIYPDVEKRELDRRKQRRAA